MVEEDTRSLLGPWSLDNPWSLTSMHGGERTGLGPPRESERVVIVRKEKEKKATHTSLFFPRHPSSTHSELEPRPERSASTR